MRHATTFREAGAVTAPPMPRYRDVITIPQMPETPAGPAAHRACRVPASLILRAVAFAGGASAIGMAVVPTEMMLSAGALPSQIVIARLAWGALTLLLICLLVRPHMLRKPLHAHGRLCLVGLLLGWATAELYTRALAKADVLPVIVLLVAASAVTGMVLQLGRRFRAGHVFVLLAVLVSVAATVHSASPAFGLSTAACAFALGAGVIYGALPVLCRNAGRAPDVAAVMYYIGYGAVWAVVILWLTDPPALAASVDVVVSTPGLVAGALCTGLGYALFQVGISPDMAGRRIGACWAGLLFGFEPITAIAASGLFLGQAVSVTSTVFAIAFVALVGLAGPTMAAFTQGARD